MRFKIFRILLMIFFASSIIMVVSNNTVAEWVDRIDLLLEKPHIKAFLDTIAFAEGTFGKEEYNALYCGHTFKDFSDHPRCVISPVSYASLKKSKNNVRSSAAGRYQILERVWDSISKEMNLKDFSPINQDRAALGLIRDMGALSDINAQRFEEAVKKLSSVWSSFPYAEHDQRTVSMGDVKSFYNNRFMIYKKSKI